MKKIKAILLFSGGLDSILAGEILKREKIELMALNFESVFFCSKNAKKSARELKIPIRILDITKDLLNLIKKGPKYGFGSQMNPCIDCHILMLKKAKKIMKKEKFDFVATGEVLGQRPFSQNKKALEIIEKEAGLKGLLLRPLSAKLLKKTLPEKRGWVKRENLFNIFGRSRKRQIELAKKFKIKWYPTPAGGCLLTDPQFSERLKGLMNLKKNFDINDIELLKVGRHFIFDKVKIVVGRNEKENLKIKKLAKKSDVLIEIKNYPGPTILIRNYKRGKIKKEIIEKAKEFSQKYSKKAKNKENLEFKIF